MTEVELRKLACDLSDRLNSVLCEMKEGYDDSICGFNEAWDVMRKFFDDKIKLLGREYEPQMNPVDDAEFGMSP